MVLFRNILLIIFLFTVGLKAWCNCFSLIPVDGVRQSSEQIVSQEQVEKSDWQATQMLNYSTAYFNRNLDSVKLFCERGINLINGNLREVKDSTRSFEMVKILVRLHLNLARVRMDKSLFAKAMDSYSACLDLCNRIRYDHGLEQASLGLGNLFRELGLFDLSNMYFDQYSNLTQTSVKSENRPDFLLGYGLLLEQEKIEDSAINILQKGLKYAEQHNNSVQMALFLKELGRIHFKLNDDDIGLQMLEEAHQLSAGFDDKKLKLECEINLARAYLRLGILDESMELLTAARRSSRLLGVPKSLAECLQLIGEVYGVSGYPDSAYHYVNRAKSISKGIQDDVDLIDAVVHHKLNYYNRLIIKQKDGIQVSSGLKSSQFDWFIGSGFILILLGLLVLLVRTGLLGQSVKKDIDETRNKINEAQSRLANLKVLNQDNEGFVERILNGVMPSKSNLNSALPTSFLSFKRKEILGGDFFWMEEYQGEIFFAVASCNSSKVTNGLLGIIVSNILTKSLYQKQIQNTAELLKQVNESVLRILPTEETVDLSISLCALSTKDKSLRWTGTRYPLILVSNGQLIEYPSSIISIGEQIEHNVLRESKIYLSPEDMIYVYTNYNYGHLNDEMRLVKANDKFNELLLKASAHQIDEQKIELDELLENDSTSEEHQFCVIGVKV